MILCKNMCFLSKICVFIEFNVNFYSNVKNSIFLYYAERPYIVKFSTEVFDHFKDFNNMCTLF